MSECISLLSLFQKNHFHMVQSLERLMESTLTNHFTDDFKPIQERQKKLHNVVKEYDQIHRKLYTKGKDPTLMEQLALKESQFHKEFNVYYQDLRLSLEKVTTEIRERLCSYMFIFSDFSLTHGDQTEKLQPLLYSLTGQLKQVKEEAEQTKRQMRNSKRFSRIVDRNTQQGLEKEGYIMVLHSGLNTSWKLNWLVIRDGHFFCFKRWKSSTPKVSLDLRFVTVKTEFAFDESAHLLNIISPEVSLVLKPPCFQDFLAWKEMLENSIKRCFQVGSVAPRTRSSTPDVLYGEEHQEGQQLLLQLSHIAGNSVCADCSVAGPDWASLNLGILVCHDCSGVHRSLGVHVSKIRSTLMDRWTKAQLEIMRSLGNERANAIWEADLDPSLKPQPNDRRVIKQKFILSKYVNKTYVQFPARESASVDAALTVAVRESNLEKAYRWLVHGANINAMYQGATLLHYVVKKNNATFVEFLLHHDCLPNLLDDVELTALDHALHLGNEECVALLVACGAEKSGHAPSIVHSPSVPAHRKKKRPLTQENKAANKHSLLSKSLGEIDLGNVPSPSRRHAVVFRNMSPAPSPDQAPSSPAVDFAPRPISLGDEELQVSPKIPQHKYKSRLRQSSTEPGTTDDDDGDDADKE